ncbi:hypothetical protein GCM10027276_36460 [Comamonas piscis]
MSAYGHEQALLGSSQSVLEQTSKHSRFEKQYSSKRRELLAYEHQSGSSDGRFELQVELWEARNTHWVLTPQLLDTNGRILFKPVARAWSVESTTWTGAHVRIRLRKYPGDQRRPCVEAFVDCEREMGSAEDGEEVPLSQLEAELERLLSKRV